MIKACHFEVGYQMWKWEHIRESVFNIFQARGRILFCRCSCVLVLALNYVTETPYQRSLPLQTDRREAELWNREKPKFQRISRQVWYANMTRKKAIRFYVSHANSFMVSHWFVLQDAIKWKRTAFDIETMRACLSEFQLHVGWMEVCRPLFGFKLQICRL